MKLYDLEFTHSDEHLTLSERSCENGITQIDISCHWDGVQVPSPILLSFCIPYHGIASFLTPCHIQQELHPRPEWSPTSSMAQLSRSAPMLQCVGYDDSNCCTVALSDVQIPTEITAGVVEEDGTVRFTVRLFTKRTAPRDRYEAVLYIDRRSILYTHALHDLSVYWQVMSEHLPCPVPEAALHPLYSFWYSYHQCFTADEVVEECARAKALGFDTVILDDGWQTEDNRRGYAYCGDWEVASQKIPDVRAMADAVHALDMKLVFWFSVPFVGIYADCFSRFEGMYLDSGKSHLCLDPRFPEVRAFLIEKWVRAMKEWDLDGLKLDFIDSMKLTEHSAIDDPRMDEPTLEGGIDRLLREGYEAITTVKPDALIEFRQDYIGPIMQAYGNMLRVSDCPNDAHSQRMRSMKLRLLTPETAVHSDMLMWNAEEHPVSAARQLLAAFFTVPQISVRLDTISEDQRRMLTHYLSVWREHREVLLTGEIYPHCPDCHFPFVEVENETERFAVCYAPTPWQVASDKPLTLLNATDTPKVYIELSSNTKRHYTVYDVYGDIVAAGDADEGLHSFPVPPSGMLTIE